MALSQESLHWMIRARFTVGTVMPGSVVICWEVVRKWRLGSRVVAPGCLRGRRVQLNLRGLFICNEGVRRVLDQHMETV